MGVNLSGLLFKKEVASNRQYIENLLQKHIVREEKIPYDGNEFNDVSEDHILVVSKNGSTLIHVDFELFQDVIDRMGSDFNNRDGVGYMLSETSMHFMFQFPSRYQQNMDVYSYDDGFTCNGPNRLKIDEEDDIVFDVLPDLIKDYLGDLSGADFTVYHFGDEAYKTQTEETITTSTGDLPSIPRVDTVIKPPNVDLGSPEPQWKAYDDIMSPESHTTNSEGGDTAEKRIETDTEHGELEEKPIHDDQNKSALQEELEAFGRSHAEKEVYFMTVDELIEEFWFEAFQSDGKRDPAIVRYVIELRRRGIKSEKGKGHTLMYHHSKFSELQAEAKRLSDNILERDITRGRQSFSNGLACIRTSVLEEEKRLRATEALKDKRKDANETSSWSVFKMILVGAGILLAIAKGCG